MLELSQRSLHPERFKQLLVGHSAIFCNTRGRLGTWGIVAISVVRSLVSQQRQPRRGEAMTTPPPPLVLPGKCHRRASFARHFRLVPCVDFTLLTTASVQRRYAVPPLVHY